MKLIEEALEAQVVCYCQSIESGLDVVRNENGEPKKSFHGTLVCHAEEFDLYTNYQTT